MRASVITGFAVLCAASVLWAQEATPAQVCNIKVLSDKVQDVSSLEAWRKSFVKEGARDQDKAIAIWDSVVRFVHEDSPPKEFLNWEGEVNDPIKTMNVYGYALCNNTASELVGLARYAGFKARGWNVQGHVVADVFYDNAFHYFDASFIEYFPKADGSLASVEEVFADVAKWYAEHPGYKGDQAKLRQFLKAEGVKAGPEVMRRCPTYDAKGQLPAKTHGWYSDMREFDGTVNNAYESGYSMGYRVNVQLREGERLTRNWSNKGLHINSEGGGSPPHCIDKMVPKDDLCYTPKWGDLAPGRIGNGMLEYNVMADGQIARSAVRFENLARVGATVRTADAAKPGMLIVRMPCSYVYLSGQMTAKVVVGNGGSIVVSLSDNNGLDWKKVTTISQPGEQKIDLKALVLRRYDYQLKFEITGKDSGFDALVIRHDIQHSQRALPALAQGQNTITFSAGPQEQAVTLEGSTDPKSKDKQLVLADFHPVMEGVSNDKPGVSLTGGQGMLTFPVRTPGDMTAVRVRTFFRARDRSDAWTIEASFDDGKTWKQITKCEGPANFMGDYATFTDVPKGARTALVRFTGAQKDTLMLTNIRVDADYTAPAAGFRPVKVTYVWDEGGQEKTNVHVADKPEEIYTITCAAKPVMKSLIVELAK